jgi:hypothetical protein
MLCQPISISGRTDLAQSPGCFIGSQSDGLTTHFGGQRNVNGVKNLFFSSLPQGVTVDDHPIEIKNDGLLHGG